MNKLTERGTEKINQWLQDHAKEGTSPLPFYALAEQMNLALRSYLILDKTESRNGISQILRLYDHWFIKS